MSNLLEEKSVVVYLFFSHHGQYPLDHTKTPKPQNPKTPWTVFIQFVHSYIIIFLVIKITQMEDIEDLLRMDPMEQVRYEKEQNLYSIIKTVEYLVSLPLS